MKRYEGLFILNSSGKEDALKDTIDKISAEITTQGGKIETVQKMDKKSFTRIADRKFTSGFYVNIVFESAPAAVAQMRQKFSTNEEVFRVMFTAAPVPKPEAK
ncbi:MAG TPA: 30S ribosomal protein S6 [Verrucomicrobiae bacterium]|nr:30S ribosomal protein S6 [Verrucomicrobiae bacterium]